MTRTGASPDPAPSRFGAILRGRCPRCRSGAIFAGWWRVHRECPACGLLFQREPGYFVGAMYVSYALVVPVMGAIAFGVWFRLLPGWPFGRVVLLLLALFLPAVPLIFRYSRILWIHLDRKLDP